MVSINIGNNNKHERRPFELNLNSNINNTSSNNNNNNNFSFGNKILPSLSMSRSPKSMKSSTKENSSRSNQPFSIYYKKSVFVALFFVFFSVL